MNIPNELRQLLERIPLQLLIENGYNQTAAQLRILLAQPAAQTGVGTGFDYSITTTTSNSLAQQQRHMEAAREQIAKRDAKLAGVQVERPQASADEEERARKDDAAFNLRQLFLRGAKALNLEPDETIWFEIVGELEKMATSAAQSAPTEPKPTGLSRGWNLVRQCDGFVIGHSTDEPKESHKQQALADGRVYVPFMVEQSAPAGEREAVAAEAAYYRATLRNVLKDIRDDLARGGLAESWHGVAETISVVLSNDSAAWQRTQAAVMPEGWKLVPVNLTTEQIAADPYGMGYGRLHAVWRALLAAAPAQPAERQEPVVHACAGCVACEGSPESNNNPCHVCGGTVSAAQDHGEVQRLRDECEYLANENIELKMLIKNMRQQFSTDTRQPGAGVVMPERKSKPYGKLYMPDKYEGWNACLDEFARLNGMDLKLPEI